MTYISNTIKIRNKSSPFLQTKDIYNSFWKTKYKISIHIFISFKSNLFERFPPRCFLRQSGKPTRGWSTRRRLRPFDQPLARSPPELEVPGWWVRWKLPSCLSHRFWVGSPRGSLAEVHPDLRQNRRRCRRWASTSSDSVDWDCFGASSYLVWHHRDDGVTCSRERL